MPVHSVRLDHLVVLNVDVNDSGKFVAILASRSN
jgi:hypothetical protein